MDDMLRRLLISILGCFLVANNTNGLTFDDLSELFEGVQGSSSGSEITLRENAIRDVDYNLRFEDLAELFENMKRISETSIVLLKENTALAERELRFEDWTRLLESVPRYYLRIDSRGKVTDSKSYGLQFEDFFELFERPRNYFQVANVSSDNKKNIGEKDFELQLEDLIELFEVSYDGLTKGEDIKKVQKRYTDNLLQFLGVPNDNTKNFEGKDQTEMECNNRWPLISRPGVGVEQDGSGARTPSLINLEDLNRDEKRGSDNHSNDEANTTMDRRSSYQVAAKMNAGKDEKSGLTTNVLNVKSAGVSEGEDTKSTVNADAGKIINDFDINNAAKVEQVENLNLSGNNGQGMKDGQNGITDAFSVKTVAGGNHISITGNNFSGTGNGNSTKNSEMLNASTMEKNEISHTNEMDKVDKSKLNYTGNITTVKEGDFSSKVGGQVSKLNVQNMLVATSINNESGETHSNSSLSVGGIVHSKSLGATGNNAERLGSEAGIVASELSKEENSNGEVSANSAPTIYGAEVSNLNVVPEGNESGLVKFQLTRRERRRLNRQKRMKELEKDTVLR